MTGITIGAPTAGFQMQEWTSLMISTNTVTAGDLVVIDEDTFDTAARQTFDTVTQCSAAAEIEESIFGIALADITAGEAGEIGWQGKFRCLVAGTIALGDPLSPIISSDTIGAPTPAATLNEKIVAIPLEAGTAEILVCWFDGVHGFGHANGSTT